MERRNTKQRQIIYEVALTMFHPSADEVFEKVKENNLNISRATVYRNLAILCENNKLKKICFENNSARFDTNVCNHNHFVCIKCGKIIDLPSTNFTAEQDLLNGLKILDKTVIYYGICNDCQKNIK